MKWLHSDLICDRIFFVRLVLDMRLQVWHPTMGNESHPTARSEHRYTVLCFIELEKVLSKSGQNQMYSHMSGWIQLIDYITLTAHGRVEVTRWPNFSKSTKILDFLVRLYFSKFFFRFWILKLGASTWKRPTRRWRSLTIWKILFHSRFQILQGRDILLLGVHCLGHRKPNHPVKQDGDWTRSLERWKIEEP